MTGSLLARIQYYGRRLFAAPLFGFRVFGDEDVPRSGGLIIACNHISELDPPILGFAVPRNVAFMAKVELFRSRRMVKLMREFWAYPVNRSGIDTVAVRTTLDYLRKGLAVVVYPEGTRSHDGRLLPVKAGIGLLAAASGAPVMPAFIWGTDHPARALLRRGDPFSVHFGPLLTPERLRAMKSEGGTRGMADGIMAAIADIGIKAGLYEDQGEKIRTGTGMEIT
jgi:1-acyl-sn-glycerol-3-phosphate acyltransferase